MHFTFCLNWLLALTISFAVPQSTLPSSCSFSLVLVAVYLCCGESLSYVSDTRYPLGFSREEYWSGLLCPPKGSSQPRDRTLVSCIAGGSLLSEPAGKPVPYTKVSSLLNDKLLKGRNWPHLCVSLLCFLL